MWPNGPRRRRKANPLAKVVQNTGRNAKRPMLVHQPLALTGGQQHFATVQNSFLCGTFFVKVARSSLFGKC